MVRGGLFAAAVAMVGASVADYFWVFLLSRILLGLGSGAVAPAIRRIVVADSAERMGANLGRLASFEVAGFGVGPVFAAAVAQFLGLRAPFIWLAALLTVALAASMRLDLSVGAQSETPRVIRRLLAVPAMRAALFSCVAFYVTVGTFDAVWAVLVRGQGASTWLIGLTLSLFTAPMIVLAPLGGRLSQSKGPMRVASFSIAAATLCTFSYGVLPSLWMLLLVSMLHAFADSFTMPANQVATAMAGSIQDASSSQGLLGATGLAAAGLSGLISGYAYEHFGRAALFTGAAGIMAVCLLLALRFVRVDVRATGFVTLGANPPA
jgi:MFS family permease